jgi:excisionase family DNA binding protein
MTPAQPAPLIPPIVDGIAAQELGVTQAAQLVGRGERTIRRLIAEGVLPAIRLPSGALRIRVADLDRIGEPVVPASRTITQK